jgi:predicted HTH transcriptional regulator
MASLRIPVTLKNLLRARSVEKNLFLAEYLEALLIRDMQHTGAEKMQTPTTSS